MSTPSASLAPGQTWSHRHGLARLPHRGEGETVSRWRRRRDERGAAVFVVVLVLTLISAIGVFSMRSAGVVDLAAGFNRQNVQSSAMAEFGAKAAATYVGSNKALVYNKDRIAGCASNYMAANPLATCLALRPALLSDVFTALAPVAFPDGLSGRLNLDGSPTTVRAEFAVELTDQAVANTKAGVGNEGGDKAYSMTFKSVARVYPTDATNPSACSPGSGRALSQQAIRAHVTVPIH